MEFSRHTGFMKREIKRNAVFRWHERVFAGGEKKCRRSLRRYVQFVRKFLAQFCVGIFAKQIGRRSLMRIGSAHPDHRVTQDRKIRASAGPIDGIGGGGIPRVEMSCGGSRQMAT